MAGESGMSDGDGAKDGAHLSPTYPPMGGYAAEGPLPEGRRHEGSQINELPGDWAKWEDELSADGKAFLWRTPWHEEKERDQYLRRKYGLLFVQVEAILGVQDHRCPGCRRPFGERVPQRIDHSRRTGEIRGVLCDGCNKRPSWEWVEDYLADPPARKIGPFFVPLSRLEAIDQRREDKANRQTARRAAARKSGKAEDRKETPPSNYKDKIKETLRASGRRN